MSAPLDDSPDKEEERAAIEEAARGGYRTVPGSVVTAEIARRAHDER